MRKQKKMAKDISQYIDFTDTTGQFPKRSIKSVMNIPMTVLGWKILESRFRDGNPSGMFVQMLVEIDFRQYIVNTGSGIVMEQLEKIRDIKAANGEDDLAFTCVAKVSGKGVKLCPSNMGEQDVRKIAGAQGEQNGSPDYSL